MMINRVCDTPVRHGESRRAVRPYWSREHRIIYIVFQWNFDPKTDLFIYLRKSQVFSVFHLYWNTPFEVATSSFWHWSNQNILLLQYIFITLSLRVKEFACERARFQYRSWQILLNVSRPKINPKISSYHIISYNDSNK